MSALRDRFRVLVIDDEPEIVRDLVDLLKDEGYSAEGVASGSEGRERLEREPYNLVICDLRMPAPDGMEILRWVREARPDTAFIMLTAHAEPDLARRAVQAGCLDYVTKPWNTFELLMRVHRVAERWDLIAQRERLLRWIRHVQGEDDALDTDLVGRSHSLREVFDLARRVAPTEATVLLRGESGTGKSVLAAAIHRMSPRSGAPLLKVNCGAIPEHLLESELFGHEKGAFTGAVREKPGLFEVAEGGSLLLDEVGDTSPAVQVKLLQAIEERSFMRVGGTRPIQADVRLLAATHQDLEEAIRRGDFREDLYYRLNVFPIVVPPLRERREDIPGLVEHFLKRRGLDLGKVASDVLDLLSGYSFPGNVRELENLVERALILAGDGRLERAHFPSIAAVPPAYPVALPVVPDHGISLEEVEKSYILAALVKTGGNKSRAAELLGMTRRTLYSRMERHGIPLQT